MLEILLILLEIPNPNELNPNTLILGIVALLVAGASGVKVLDNIGKNKIEQVKQGKYNADKVDEIEKLLKANSTDLEQVKKLLNSLQNKQEIDNEYLSKLLDKLEKDFSYYRDFIINNIRK